MAKLWAGRAEKETAQIADDFNSSLHFDCRMYRQDITGSMAHAAMLAHCGILTEDEAQTLIFGLAGIMADLDEGKLQFDPSAEDIHMFVEQVLTERLGDVGKKLHTARSRNDQVALDLRLYLRQEIAAIRALVLELLAATAEMADLHPETPVITMSMGTLGAVSRLAGETFGSAMTFANPGQASAPGQVSLNIVNEVLDALHL